jgi:hydrogenase maturation protease
MDEPRIEPATDRTTDRTTDASGDRQPTVWLLVCGERMREDDGAAEAAVELLPDDVRDLVRIEIVGLMSVEALLDVPEGSRLVVADAASGIEPGRVVTLPLAAVARDGAVPATTHVMPPDQVIALATELGGTAPRGVFVGIGGAEFGFGDELSPVVRAALPEYVAALSEAIRVLAADAGETPRS